MSPRDPHARGRRELPHATLGRRRKLRFDYDPRLLEAVPVAGGRREDPWWVSLNCLRFSALCPVTGQPDWGEITVNYVPGATIVESKSLKEYLHSFRMHGSFHEDVCRTIRDDLVACVSPRYLEVVGCFDSRGSIAIWPYVQYASPGDAAMERLREGRFAAYRPGMYGHEGYGRRI